MRPASRPLPGPYRDAWVCQELAVNVMREVSSRCDAAGLPVLAVKGAITSRLLYDDIAERPISDVDVRIRPRDFWRWREVAGDWAPRSWNVAWTYRNRAYDFAPLSLDVEADIGPPGLCALTVDTMLSRAVPFEVGAGVRVLVPELHDHAVVLVVNAFKDRFVVGNPWSIVDLERIVRMPDFQSDEFVDLVFVSRITTLTWIVASWLEAERDSAPWGSIRRAIEARTEPRRLYAALYDRIARSSGGSSIPACLYMTAGADDLRGRFRAVATTVAWLGERWTRGRIGARAVG